MRFHWSFKLHRHDVWVMIYSQFKLLMTITALKDSNNIKERQCVQKSLFAQNTAESEHRVHFL